jgi:hypothetical protein
MGIAHVVHCSRAALETDSSNRAFQVLGRQDQFRAGLPRFEACVFCEPMPKPGMPGLPAPRATSISDERVGAELEKLKLDELKFYHIIYNQFWKPGPRQKEELGSVLKAASENRHAAATQ